MSIEWRETDHLIVETRPIASRAGRLRRAWNAASSNAATGTQIGAVLLLLSGWLIYVVLPSTPASAQRPVTIIAQAVNAPAPDLQEALAREKLAEALLDAERHPNRRTEPQIQVLAAPSSAAKSDASVAGSNADEAPVPATAPQQAARKMEPESVQPGALQDQSTEVVSTIVTSPKSDPVKLSDAPPLDPETRKGLRDRAIQMIRHGDIAGARVTIGRLEREGDPAGLLLLARTYDVKVLARLGVLGIKGDAARAMQLYKRAADAGNKEAEEALKAAAE